jgi:hypothetical protein
MIGKNGYTRSDYLKAEWAAKVFRESGRDRTTARALHYFALGRQDYPIFNKAGLIDLRKYEDKDAAHLTAWIALAKRLKLIDWDNLPDESVGEYGEMVFCPLECGFSYGYSLDRPGSFELSKLKEYLQSSIFALEYTPFSLDQPYHIELWVEKATMNSILQPLCARYNAILVTFQGHCSWGGAWKLCKRVNNDNRPALIFYLSDLDSSGFRMAAELSEKIAEINKNFFGGHLNIRVRRIGLTPKQVVDLEIPQVDRKSTEKANNVLYKKYVEHYGLDPAKKAELDALERYYPGGVASFVEGWMSRFYDPDLTHRCAQVTDDLVGSISNVYELPKEVVALRQKVLAYLEQLIELEDGLELPAGEEIEVDLKTETDDPADESWLLDTKNEIYPSREDIDFCERGEVY